MYSAVVAGLNAVRRSSRDAEYKAQCSNGQGQAPMLHFGFEPSGWEARCEEKYPRWSGCGTAHRKATAIRLNISRMDALSCQRA